jgi:DNA repair protein RadC
MNDDQIINRALEIITNRLRSPGVAMTCPKAVTEFLRLHLAERTQEVFGVMFFDNQMHLIEFDIMFRGTLNGCSVHTREVARQALLNNTGFVILAHNHPSQMASPSEADIRITNDLVEALGLFDITVRDHIIIGGTNYYSFAEHRQL